MKLQSLAGSVQTADDWSLLDLDLLSTQELARLCAQEIVQFRKRGTSDERYGRELFRRAIIRRDDIAWICIYQQFTPLVVSWMSHHPQTNSLLEYDGIDSVVNAVFAKFSLAITPANVNTFHSLGSLLKYLKCCVHSVVADAVRVHQTYQVEDSLDLIRSEATLDDPAEDVVAHATAEDLWQKIKRLLKDEKERVFITMIYLYDMKPGEIYLRYHHLFSTIDEVYRVKHKLFERLRRNNSLKAIWLGS